MADFLNAYNQLLQNPKSKSQFGTYVYNQGISVFKNTYDLATKEDVLLKLIFLYPENSDLYYMMAELFKQQTPAKAITWYKICHQVDPNHKDNIIDMVKTLFENGLTKQVFEIVKFDDNQSSIFNKLMDDPRFLGTYSRCNFQQLYYKNGVQCLLKLIKQSSTTPCYTRDEKITKWSNYHDLGYVFCAMGEIDKSLQYTNKAVDLANKFNLDMWNKLLSFSNSLCYADFLYSDNEAIFKQYQKINNYLPDQPSFHFEGRKKLVRNLYENNPNQTTRKIKIGYLSSDYMYHAVANFIIPILKHHDRSKFEIILYASQSEFNAEIFTNLKIPHHMIKDLSDKDAATLINKHNIDILFDLNGHTVSNRLGVFTYHPAPIQIAYLGFPNTTGLKSIQYRITDTTVDSPISKQRYSETLLKLPRCFLLYKSINQETPITPRKTKDTIILAAINKENKNSTFALETWKIILKECPNANILIKLETFDNNEERMEFYSSKLDVDRKRIIIINKLQNEEYNKLFSMVDVLLDTFPYSGTTTTCNALFNSIPLVSLYNDNYHAHNVSCSLLTNSGLPELVAKTQEEYVDIVKQLVNKPSRIDGYKKSIREKFLKLMEPGPFMKDYEGALIDVYNKFYGIAI
jgi:predicted O-linked N-acetylglucosamine transferase (SPINDLY family)